MKLSWKYNQYILLVWFCPDTQHTLSITALHLRACGLLCLIWGSLNYQLET